MFREPHRCHDSKTSSRRQRGGDKSSGEEAREQDRPEEFARGQVKGVCRGGVGCSLTSRAGPLLPASPWTLGQVILCAGHPGHRVESSLPVPPTLDARLRHRRRETDM